MTLRKINRNEIEKRADGTVRCKTITSVNLIYTCHTQDGKYFYYKYDIIVIIIIQLKKKKRKIKCMGGLNVAKLNQTFKWGCLGNQILGNLILIATIDALLKALKLLQLFSSYSNWLTELNELQLGAADWTTGAIICARTFGAVLEQTFSLLRC